MKKINRILLISFLIPVLFSACQKSGKISYTLTAHYDSTAVPGNVVAYSLEGSGSVNETLEMSIEGLPGYITADFVQYIDKLPYSGTISFHFNSLSDGNMSLWHNYTVTIKATSSSNVVRKATVTFYCAPAYPAKAFEGHIFNDHESCSRTGAEVRSVNASYVSGDTVWLDGFYQSVTSEYSVPIVIDAKTRTVNVVPTMVGPYIFRGNGTFYPTGDDSIGCVIHYSRSTSSTFDTCTSTLTTSY